MIVKGMRKKNWKRVGSGFGIPAMPIGAVREISADSVYLPFHLFSIAIFAFFASLRWVLI